MKDKADVYYLKDKRLSNSYNALGEGAVIGGYGVSSILLLGQNNKSIMKNIEQGIWWTYKY